MDLQGLHVESNPVCFLLFPIFHLLYSVISEQASIVVDDTLLRRQVDLEWLVSHLDNPLVRTDESDGKVVALLHFGEFTGVSCFILLV